MSRKKKSTNPKIERQITKEEIDELRKNVPKPPDLCQWIRDNVPKSKLQEVKEYLKQYEGYFDVDKPKMVEHVYRGVKNSLKVRYAYTETVSFTGWLVYLLSPDKSEPDFKNVETDLLKIVSKESFLYNFFIQNKEANGRVEKKGKSVLGDYYVFDRATLTFLGANVMFYYILRSVVDVTEKALTDSMYKLEGTLEWEEAIASYVLSELK